jgi:hypothetical protein
MKEIDPRVKFPAVAATHNGAPQLISKTKIHSQDEARGYVAALGLRYQDQFFEASNGLAEKVRKGELDESSYLILTSAMVDARRTALPR